MTDARKVAVIGSGTMGPGHGAPHSLRKGFETTLFDIKPEQLEKAKGAVDFVYSTSTNGGFMTAAGGRRGSEPAHLHRRPCRRP